MSLIFDRFPDVARAESFAAAVRERFPLDAQVHLTVEAAQAADPFPYELDAPVVHVDRASLDDDGFATERYIERLVGHYSGRFAGT